MWNTSFLYFSFGVEIIWNLISNSTEKEWGEELKSGTDVVRVSVFWNIESLKSILTQDICIIC